MSADPCFEAWTKALHTHLQTQLRSTLADSAIAEILEPWAMAAFDDAKAQQVILLDQCQKELERLTKLLWAKEAVRTCAALEARAFYEAQHDACNKQSAADILQHKAELCKAVEIEISAFKHALKIEVVECKDKLRASSTPTPSFSISEKPVAHTNRSKKHVDPTACPLPRSQSHSQARTPALESHPPGWSPDMTTPCTSPVMELLLTQALMEWALSLQPPPTDVSVGPPEGSFELCMMEVNTSLMSAYEYPLAPSTHEVQGPSNTAFSASPSQSLPTNPPTSDVMATIMALSSQVSSLSSQFSACLEHLENLAQSYLPLAIAALWQPNPLRLHEPDVSF